MSLFADPREQAEFEIVSLSRFLEFQPVRRVQQEYLRVRVEERRGAASAIARAAPRLDAPVAPYYAPR